MFKKNLGLNYATTGGNGGIGLSIAEAIGKAGASVIISGRNKEKLIKANNYLKNLNINSNYVRADISRESSCNYLIEKTISIFGKVNILVNNAGINIRKKPQDYDLKEWINIINTNLISMYICSVSCYKEFCKIDAGKILNIGSMHSIFGAPFGSAYSASKGGVVQLTKSLANSWAKSNIQVNAILPGYINTDLTKKAKIELPMLDSNVKQRTPTGNWGNPEDLGGIAIFLSSQASNFVTGTAIPVDGGYSING